MIKGLTISAVIPCYNEEKGIENVLKNMPDYVDEIIVVDNNSTDKTANVARKFKAKVIKEKVQGYGAALIKGIRSSGNDIIVTLDGDGTYSPSYIKDLVIVLKKNNLDCIYANRFNSIYKSSMPLTNYIGNLILNFAIRILFSIRLSDSQSGMMCFKKDCIKNLLLISKGMSFSEEIKIKLNNNNFKYKDLPIEYHDNKRLGNKKLNIWLDGILNLIFLIRLRISH